MGWARFDDAYTDHPKIVTAGPLAELLDMRAILFSARYETDGHIPPAQLTRIGAGIPAVKKKAASLVDVDRWHEPGHKCKDCPQITDGWIVHDYLLFNPTRESREAERAAARERMRKAREGKQGKNKGRSSEDVRANTERTSEEVQECSDNPDPAPPPKSKSNPSPEGGAKAPLVDRVAEWLASEHRVEFEERPSLYAMYADVLTRASPLLPTDAKRHDVAMGMICEYAERVNGEKLPSDHRARIGRLLKNHIPDAVLYGVSESMDNGAGLSGEHANNPKAWLDYVTKVVKVREGAA